MGRFRTGDEFEGVVCDFGMSGEGIVKDGAYPIFVPFAIVGERVRLRVVHAKKDYAFGELIEVLTPSNERVKPCCRHFGRCGGCDLQHLSHAMQEEVKKASVERTMKKAGVDVVVPEVIAGNPWAYRNKLALPFGRMGRHGKIVLGFFEKKSHRVVPLTRSKSVLCTARGLPTLSPPSPIGRTSAVSPSTTKGRAKDCYGTSSQGSSPRSPSSSC